MTWFGCILLISDNIVWLYVKSSRSSSSIFSLLVLFFKISSDSSVSKPSALKSESLSNSSSFCINPLAIFAANNWLCAKAAKLVKGRFVTANESFDDDEPSRILLDIIDGLPKPRPEETKQKIEFLFKKKKNWMIFTKLC